MSEGATPGLPSLVCASANPDKVAEISELLDGVVQLLSRPAGVPNVVEDAPTLEGNARLKAVAIVSATGKPAIADDTGLEVDALGGEPGVRSARFAGEDVTYADNRAKLLGLLDGVPEEDRTARFRTVALVRYPDGREIIAEGVCEGAITGSERGAGGFGYDALFVPDDGDGRTFAELDAPEKHALSHRGKAFRALMTTLRESAGGSGATSTNL